MTPCIGQSHSPLMAQPSSGHYTSVKKVTHTDLWHNQPPANILQLVYRDVGAVKGTEIKVCVDAKGKFKGYVEAGANACAKATSEVNFLPAPELTYAQGDLKVLESRMLPNEVECNSKDLLNNCTKFTTTYSYTDGKQCSGNNE